VSVGVGALVVGVPDGDEVGDELGDDVGDEVGDELGDDVGDADGDELGDADGVPSAHADPEVNDSDVAVSPAATIGMTSRFMPPLPG
jgi:hypothetical protein